MYGSVSIAAGLALFASLAFAGDNKIEPLNVKTGQWHVNEVISIGGDIPPALRDRLAQMTPEQRAKVEASLRKQANGSTHSYDTCVTPESLTKAPFENRTERCTWKVLSSSSTDLEAQGTSCESAKPLGVDAVMDMKIHVVDTENVTGTLLTTASNGGHVNNSYSGKWVSATCQK